MQKQEILDHLEWDEQPPELYSNTLILALSLLFSPLLGAILFVHNLSVIGKWKSAVLVVILTILYYFLISSGLYLFSIPSIIPQILFNFLAALLFAGPLWDKLIGRHLKYRPKSPIFPLLLAIIFAILMLYARGIATAIIS